MLTRLKLKISDWKYLELFILSFLFVVCFMLRAYQIDKNLFFGPEQGRDLLVIRDIVESHKLVLIGPKTDIEGVFHGPVFYYLASVPFFLSKGNPLSIELFLIALSSLSVFPIYFLGKELFNKRVGFIASIIFVFSFGSIVMSRWLSNPPLTIPISILFFLFLTRFLKGKNFYLILVALCFGLISQVELVNFLIFSTILLSVAIVFWKRFIKQNALTLIISIGVLIFSTLGNFLLFDLRHQFLITNNVFKLFTKNSGFYTTFQNSLINSLGHFSKIFSDVIAPDFFILSVTIFILGLLSLKFIKDKIGFWVLLIWLFSPILAFTVLKYNPLYHYFAAIIIAAIFLTAIFLDRIWLIKKELAVILIVVLILINLASWIKYLPINKNVFFQSTQPDLRYVDQLSTIKEVYKQANKEPFFFQSYTIPYWSQEVWEYLFWYFGTNIYGFIPEEENKELLFVIIQNDPNNKIYQDNWLKNTVSTWGGKEEEFIFGALRTQRLRPINN